MLHGGGRKYRKAGGSLPPALAGPRPSVKRGAVVRPHSGAGGEGQDRPRGTVVPVASWGLLCWMGGLVCAGCACTGTAATQGLVAA